MKYPIALKQEVQEGAAQIYTSFDGTGAFYDIEITQLRYEDDGNQNITLTVTDPVLLAKTGGIVQGMSGSPILQNGDCRSGHPCTCQTAGKRIRDLYRKHDGT